MHTTTQDRWKTRAMLFFISQSITLFGSTLVQMAIVWYVTRNTSSGAWVAAFSVCSYLPEFVISFSGGVWADRYHRKKLIIGADFFIAVVTLAMMMRMPYISSQSRLLLALLIMSILRSLGAGIQTPAVNAVVPQLVPADQLMRFNGINAAMQSIVRFAAPAAAGVILTIGSLRSTLLIDVLTAVVGIGLLSRISISHERKERGAPVSADLKAGLSYAFSDKLIRRLLMVYGLFVFLCVPAGYLAGLFVSRVYGESYGYLTMVELAGFAGMMVGGLLMGTWGGFKSRKATLLLGLAIFGMMAILMGMSTNFIFYLALMAVYGVALTTVQTAITTLLQEKTEVAMQGRVFGLLGSMYSGCMPVGMMVFGPLADAVPLRWIMIASGVALIVLAMVLRCDRQFWSAPHAQN